MPLTLDRSLMLELVDYLREVEQYHKAIDTVLALCLQGNGQAVVLSRLTQDAQRLRVALEDRIVESVTG